MSTTKAHLSNEHYHGTFANCNFNALAVTVMQFFDAIGFMITVSFACQLSGACKPTYFISSEGDVFNCYVRSDLLLPYRVIYRIVRTKRCT